MMFKEILKDSLDEIAPKKDIVYSAKHRAESVKKQLSVRRPAAVLCALALMSGTAVFAAKLDWMHFIFGESSSIIEENINDYMVELENTEIIYTNSEPLVNVSIGDVICDGEVLYINMKLNGSTPDMIKQGQKFNAYSVMSTVQQTIMSTEEINTEDLYNSYQRIFEVLSYGDNSADCYVSLTGNKHFKKGDHIKLVFDNFYPLTDDIKENFRRECGNNNTVISFDISNDITEMAKQINIDKQAVLYTNSDEDEAREEVKVDFLTLSPLKISIQMSYEHGSNKKCISSISNYSITMKDGSKMYLSDMSEMGRSMLFSEISRPIKGSGNSTARLDANFQTVVPVEEIEYIQVGDLIIPVE